MAPPHLVAIGDALADLVVSTPPAACRRLGVEPGRAGFRGRAALDAVLAELGGDPGCAAAGGSAANTCVAFAAGGGRASLLTPSMDDALGRTIRNDLAARGVATPLVPTRGGATGRCLVLALPDGDRAFVIWQGEPWRLGALRDAVETELGAGRPCDGLLVEGYLAASEEGMEVARLALALAGSLGVPRVLALSDSGLVTEHRRRFEALLAAGAEAVIGNQAEITALAGIEDLELAAAMLSGEGLLAIATLGERGAIVRGPNGRDAIVPARTRVVSTVGAGDAFAGGFLLGMLSGSPLSECLAVGQRRASAVLGVRQARPAPCLEPHLAGRRKSA
jgi:sugar/nucleoside kinase (ribokinase family)